MTEREQLSQLAQWNRELVRENSHLHEKVSRVTHECDELLRANVALLVQGEAADVLLGAALDNGLWARP